MGNGFRHQATAAWRAVDDGEPAVFFPHQGFDERDGRALSDAHLCREKCNCTAVSLADYTQWFLNLGQRMVGTEMHAQAATMANLIKDQQLLAYDSQGIEGAGFAADPAAIAKILIDDRLAYGNHLFLYVGRLEKKMPIRLFHITIDVGGPLRHRSKIDADQGLPGASLAAEHRYGAVSGHDEIQHGWHPIQQACSQAVH